MDKVEDNAIIRMYQPGDEEGIVKLLETVFSPFPRFDIECSKLDHWKWKFLDSPIYVKTNRFYPNAVGEVDGKIVGVSHGMLYDVKVGDSIYLSRKGADVGVYEEYRQMRIYTRVNNLKQELYKKLDIKFGYSLTANPILINRTREKPQTLFPHGINYLVKIQNIDEYFNQRQKKGGKEDSPLLKIAVHGAKQLNKVMNMNPRPPQTKTEIKPIEKFDERINTFYDKVKPHYQFIVEKTKDYMNWRYCDKRGGDFKTWLAEENGEVVGFMVLRINKINPTFPEGYIMDLLALDGRSDVVENLVSFASNWFDKQGPNVVYTQIIRGHPYEKIYEKYGFLDSRIKPYLTYADMGMKPEDLQAFLSAPPSTLHYPYGEGDAV